MFNLLKKIFALSERTESVPFANVPTEGRAVQADKSGKSATYNKKQGNEFLAQGRLDGAIAGGAASQSETPDQSALRLIDEGNAIEDEGRLDEAMQRYEAAVRLVPSLARAHLNRGNILLATDKAEGALEAYTTALTFSPDYAAAHYNIGNANARMGRNETALEAYREAIRLKPDFVDAEVALGCVQEDLGRFDDAVASYRRALVIRPTYAEVHGNLGNVLRNLGRFDDAVASCRRVSEINPNHPNAHNNLGNLLIEIGNIDEAIACYRRALEIKPDFIEAMNNLGNALREIGRLDEAVTSFRGALEINPNFAVAQNNLGNALRDLGLFDNAIASYRRALEIKPDLIEVMGNLGNTLRDIGQLDEAVARFRCALEINPNSAVAHNNLGNALRDLGLLDDAMVSYRRALEIDPHLVEAQDALLFAHNCLADQSAMTMLADAKHFGELMARQACPYTTWRNTPEPTRCLRIGFVSGDFRDHVVAYFVENVLAALKAQASDRLKLFAYPSCSRFDAVSERIKACCEGWHSAVGLSDKMLARRISEDGIDILIDLSGHTAHNRLPMFAWKPAPVQVSWLGYFATTGVAAIDYLIADPWTLPETEAGYFTEKIWRLPETRLCFTSPEVNVEVAPLPALINGYVTFGCFNNLTKMNEDVVALWARVLKAVPGSRLLLKTRQLQEASVCQSVVERFGVHSVGADQLMMEGGDIRAKYLAAYHKVDIALDPFPYPGGTTSVEGLWMGVPVLTLAGERFLSRQGVGLLMNSGLPEWVAANTDDYVARAESHAKDLQALAALRKGLRQQVLASPIFDAPRFARHFEDALRGMWQKWCEQRQKGTEPCI